MKKFLFLLPLLLLATASVAQADETWIINPEENSDSIRVAILKHTGFFRKTETRIRYRVADGEILDIEQDGELLPRSRYDEFAEDIVMIREINKIDLMQPEIDRVRAMLKDTSISREQRMAATDSLFKQLAGFKSNIANSYINVLESETEIYLDEKFMLYDLFELKLNLLMGELLDNPKFKAESIEYRKQEVKVDGKEVPPEINKELLELYEDIFGHSIGMKETLQIEFD